MLKSDIYRAGQFTGRPIERILAEEDRLQRAERVNQVSGAIYRFIVRGFWLFVVGDAIAMVVLLLAWVLLK